MTARKALMAIAAGGIVLSLAACSASTGSTGDAGTAENPTELTFWGKTQGQKAQVELWNEEHPETQITYVEQGGDADLSQALQNATTAGNAPDVFEVPRTYSVSFLADGVSRDISEWFDNDDGAIAEGAFDFVSVGDTVVGVPYATNPTFNAINTATFGQFGFDAPTDWAEFLDQAKTMQQQSDIKSMNLPGEDPSYLRDLATQFGAEWWQPEDDAWKIGFTSEESLAAGEIIQQAIDADIVSNNTYIEWDALMQFFASGLLSQFTTSTWQLPVYEQNFASSVGDWELAPYPAESADDELVSPSYYNIYGISPSSEHPDAAVEFARWTATDPDAIALLADPTEGAAAFPVVADPESVIDQLLPDELLGDTRADAPAVVLEAANTARSMIEGPNQAAATEELTDWWAKVITKEATMQELLEHMQQWTIDDLTSKNIQVAE
ncbi:ABC transporter substrate-binding protein [Microbacterium phyllosphaerae]|uniref:ABC transporter substrate-binding protein n=1 Tax=Microbacterium phyllosphaerae TaxID=124798 RepID=UPI000EA16747|nr:extracellular solute-binding protein [Microbacterium phyllosphaerae]